MNMGHYPYWSLESWGSDYPPENAEEIIEQANRPCEFYRRMTNADRIRAMTDKQLARWIADNLIEPGYYNGDECYNIWLKWLKQEVIS